MNKRKWVIGALAAGAGSAAAIAAASRIEPLLPAAGQSRCFSGSFDTPVPLTFGFHSERRTDVAHVTRFVLKLDRDPDQTPHRDPASGYSFDWRYDFRLLAETSDKGTFHTGGQCDWLEDAVAKFETGIYCFIDCDGGGVRVQRVAARSAVDVIWDSDGWLKMSSCGGGGDILRAGDATQTFRLRPAPDAECAAMPEPDN